MSQVESLSHTRWECKYHIVFIPKYRRKALFGQLRKKLGGVFHRLARQKENRIEEEHIMSDHVHMMISIPPKYAVSQVVGYIKGKSAIHIARAYLGRKKNYVGQHFWARGVFCLDGRLGRAGYPGLYSAPGDGRSQDRPVTIDVVAPLRGSRSRQAPFYRPL
jgi:putative transposase